MIENIFEAFQKSKVFADLSKTTDGLRILNHFWSLKDKFETLSRDEQKAFNEMFKTDFIAMAQNHTGKTVEHTPENSYFSTFCMILFLISGR
jgi:hypothetical protein